VKGANKVLKPLFRCFNTREKLLVRLAMVAKPNPVPSLRNAEAATGQELRHSPRVCL